MAENFEPYDVITENDKVADFCRFKAHSENPAAGPYAFGRGGALYKLNSVLPIA
jgi:hypothetical protein